MDKIIQEIEKSFLKESTPDFRSGDTVRVHQRILAPASSIKGAVSTGKSAGGKKEEGKEKERIQIFEGLVIARKHGRGIKGTFTVRAIVEGVGVERVFPLHSPLIYKIEVVDKKRSRKAKLYYLRGRSPIEIRRKLKPRK